MAFCINIDTVRDKVSKKNSARFLSRARQTTRLSGAAIFTLFSRPIFIIGIGLAHCGSLLREVSTLVSKEFGLCDEGNVREFRFFFSRYYFCIPYLFSFSGPSVAPATSFLRWRSVGKTSIAPYPTSLAHNCPWTTSSRSLREVW